MSEECFFQSDDLEEALSLYKEENRGKIKKLSDFLDNIQTNRKYYRTGIQKNKKYKKEVTEDTNIIKTINSLINRTTLNNYDTIKPKIINMGIYTTNHFSKPINRFLYTFFNGIIYKISEWKKSFRHDDEPPQQSLFS